MKKTRFIFLCLSFLCFSVMQTHALSLVIQVIQQDSSAIEELETTKVLEESLVDCFFESGAVVSDAPVYIFTDEATTSEQIYKVLVESAEGSMDFLVTLTVSFDRSNLKNPDAVQLSGIKKISWTSKYVRENKIVSNGSCVPKGSSSELSKDDRETEIKRFVSDLAKEIHKGLRK